MAIKHNQTLVKNHFRKDWQRRVRCHFDQPGKKVSRRNARAAKAAQVAPRPVDLLRPVVRCPTVKYNRRVRAGRGFTLAELKAAGIPRHYAPTVGISVDARRQNLSEESLAINVERLKQYVSRLIVFPRKSNKAKHGDSSKDELKAAKETTSSTVLSLAAEFPFVAVDKSVKEIKKSDMPAAIEGGAYIKLRQERANKRNQGAREKRAKDKAEDEKAKK